MDGTSHWLMTNAADDVSMCEANDAKFAEQCRHFRMIKSN